MKFEVTTEQGILGMVVFCQEVSGKGWRYFPHHQATPSRKLWPTAEAAVKNRIKIKFNLKEV